MTAITNTSQLSTFSVIRSVLRTNPTIAAKFPVGNFYEFEPKHKSQSFRGFPYIIISIPNTDDVDEYLGDITTNREFNCEIIMRMEYEARDNLSSYASNIIKELDNSLSTFTSSGYYMKKVTFEGASTLTIDQKELVEARFTLILTGEVT